MNIKTSSGKLPVIVIFAPTASGKTALTRELFSPVGSHFILNAEVISADSQQVYKYMDIGTAKAEPELTKEIPHHLIDILEPDKQMNVSDFVDMADEACGAIASRGNIPVLCGGTGFYIRNFLYGVAPTPMSDEKIRNELKDRIANEGNETLYNELKAVDPESASKIHVNDAYRICRALEVYYISGQTRTSYKIEKKLRNQYDFLFIILEPERELLYSRINSRVDKMVEMGLIEEVKELMARGYSKETPGMKAIGYSEWFKEDGSVIDFENAEEVNAVLEEIKHHSRKYAKKQYTYIRDIPEGVRVEYSASEEDICKVGDIIKGWPGVKDFITFRQKPSPGLEFSSKTP